MKEILIFPPLAFIVSYIGIWLFDKATVFLMPKVDEDNITNNAKHEAYSCGENYEHIKIEPDYEHFFPFAIFFTVLHVAGLMIATLATSSLIGFASLVIPGVYIVMISVILAILYMKN